MQVSKDSLDKFFSDIKSVSEKKESFCSVATNIIYITTRCNLNCEYCYEKDQRSNLSEQKDINKEEITAALEKISLGNRTNSPSTVVIFGGEPLLRPDLVEFMIEEAQRINVSGFAFCMTTNGLYFLKKENALWIKNLMSKSTLSLELSWDGSGHDRRQTLDGKSSRSMVERAIDILEEAGVFVTLRYTVHKGNYKDVVFDLIYALERWKNIKKLQTSYAYSELDSEEGGKDLEKINKDLYRGIFLKYKVPLCQEVCDICDRCVKTGKANYFIPEKPVLEQKENCEGKLQATDFNHWL